MQGAIEKGGPHGSPPAPPLLNQAKIENNASGQSLSELLAAGEIDALPAHAIPTPHPDVVPLFAGRESGREGILSRDPHLPIMHLVAIRRDRYERDPWIASSLYKAFVAARDIALANMRRPGAHAYMLPWIDHDVAEIADVFGDDLWPYGVEANRPTLTALVEYMTEQHLIAASPAIEDLFVPFARMAGK